MKRTKSSKWISRLIVAGGVSLFFMVNPVYAGNQFPEVDDVRGVSQINKSYLPYLRFVLDAGSQVDARQAKALADTFAVVQQRSPEAASKFLRGLRFELLQKISEMGAAPESVTTRNTELQRYIKLTMGMWTREADEFLFRAGTNSLAKR